MGIQFFDNVTNGGKWIIQKRFIKSFLSYSYKYIPTLTSDPFINIISVLYKFSFYIYKKPVVQFHVSST
jgi:hypothetical protein